MLAPTPAEAASRFALPRAHRRVALLCILLLASTLVACAPAAAPADLSPAAQTLQRTAEIAFHRMEIGRLQTGSYTTNVLVDLDIASGTRWTLLDYPADGSSYVLQFTSDQVPAWAWRVTPAGVRRVPFP